MQAEGLLREGRLLEALAALEDGVRRNPSDPRLRTFLFQLLCVLGRWERAITQAEVSAELDPGRLLLARMYQPAAACEVFREEVFAGRRSPLVFGEPPAWVAWLIQATHLAAAGRFAAAADLRDRALDAAPAVAGTINDKPFQWIFDADSRLGPVLEAILDGKYYWIPFDRIRCIALEPPQDLRDLVWAPAAFTWANGGQAARSTTSLFSGSSMPIPGWGRSSKPSWTASTTGFLLTASAASRWSPRRTFATWCGRRRRLPGPTAARRRA
jgi:type VI secretion system protein ImpE